jgi:phospholipid/cholesterol/gamma-HCH transport system ATP-binding protein
MSPEHLVEIENIRFAYGPRQVFKGLSLRIPRGRLVVVLGASGSGKTTLMRLIGAQLHPAGGRVTVDGQDVHRLGVDELYRLRRRMGMMFQAGGLFSDLSVFENVAFPLREHYELPEPVVRELVLMKLHAVGLRGARDLQVGELSGGMTRRVALARAIAIDPMLTLYDEPFAGLDPISINVIAELIRVLNDALGTTSVVVTYDVTEALKIADYVFVLGDGVLAAEGTPDDMRASKDPFLRQFFDALPDGPIEFDYPAARPYEADLGL